MGLWDTVCDWGGRALDFVGGVFGGGSSGNRDRDYGGSYSSSSSSTVTNYDPDKVKIAELENQRVELVKNAQLELIEFNAQMEATLLEAKCKGFVLMQKSMMDMLKEVNILAEQRLALLEKGSQENILQVEKIYGELAKDIQNDDFMVQKIPELLHLANQFAEDSPSHKLYMTGIEREIATHFDFKSSQLRLLGERCQTVVNSVISSKEKMQAHIDEVVVKRIEQIELNIQNIAQLDMQANAQLDYRPSSENNVKLLGKKE